MSEKATNQVRLYRLYIVSTRYAYMSFSVQNQVFISLVTANFCLMRQDVNILQLTGLY